MGNYEYRTISLSAALFWFVLVNISSAEVRPSDIIKPDEMGLGPGYGQRTTVSSGHHTAFGSVPGPGQETDWNIHSGLKVVSPLGETRLRWFGPWRDMPKL